MPIDEKRKVKKAESKATVDMTNALLSEDPAEFVDVLQSAPPEEQVKILRQVSMGIVSSRTSPEAELFKKITPEHISKSLDTEEKTMVNSYKERRETKIFVGVLVIIVLAVFLVIIAMLRTNPDIMEKVLYTFGGLAAGLLGGYGIGKNRNN